MIWATVSCRSYFCWVYRASPSLAARNIINLILVLTIWWCHMCRVFSCVGGRGCLLWPVYSLGKIALAQLHYVLQSQGTWSVRSMNQDKDTHIPLHQGPVVSAIGNIALGASTGLQLSTSSTTAWSWWLLLLLSHFSHVWLYATL